MDPFSQHLQDLALANAAVARAGIEAGRRDGEAVRQRVAILEATLRGVRGMAETEVANGSEAWKKAALMIDEVLAK